MSLCHAVMLEDGGAVDVQSSDERSTRSVGHCAAQGGGSCVQLIHSEFAD
jgi:hypothetical protein